VSKNVAVFVDVANIFYAAKAAGVDIDYVTLLKSATAGRDFVRAYAYTGLDPENENQRQFHAFLARSGYKVISKDIRKYGDGRIKANLDIELVVDMMRMAQHIDIAVVVSGDGDFAPAIRAVQQLGVRCEVISFRGNTSSDLIDVADVFTDITQIARVEKGARSGRRVAAEGDLSMTAVPEKETEGLARRRRSRRDERDERDEHEDRTDRTDRVERGERVERPERPAAEPLPGNVIVLPGERLSRAGRPEDGEFDVDVDEALPATAEGVSLDAEGEGQLDGTEADRQRRRRRRGGRGRGRGRQQFEGPRPAEAGVDIVAEDDEFLEDEIAPLPQHSTFGSVWDNQLGVTPPPISAAAGEPGIDEEYEDEPEIPEYLLAERRQRGRGGRPGGMRQGGGRGRGGYQSAVDRERYGRSGTSSFGGGNGNRIDRPRPQGGNRGPRPQQPRPQRPMYQEPMREQERPVTTSAEPWSEVPPEVQELLRAELARRQSQGAVRGNEGYRGQESPTAARTSEPAADSAVADAEPAPARGRRTRSAGASSGSDAATAGAASASDDPSAEAPAVATPARRGRRPSTASSTAAAAATDTVAPEAAEAPAPKPRRRRSSSASSSAAAEAPSATAEPASEAAEPATPRKRTTRSKAAAEPAAEGSTAASTGDTADAETAATPRRRTTRRTAATADAEG
jgi:uncharacterized LabA/DUF88 family protein